MDSKNTVHIKERNTDTQFLKISSTYVNKSTSLTTDSIQDSNLQPSQESFDTKFSVYQLPDHFEADKTASLGLSQGFVKPSEEMPGAFSGKREAPAQSAVGSAASEAMEI